MKERYSSRIFLAAEMKLQMDAVCSSAPSPSFGCCQLMSCRAVARDAVELLPILLPMSLSPEICVAPTAQGLLYLQEQERVNFL